MPPKKTSSRGGARKSSTGTSKTPPAKASTHPTLPSKSTTQSTAQKARHDDSGSDFLPPDESDFESAPGLGSKRINTKGLGVEPKKRFRLPATTKSPIPRVGDIASLDLSNIDITPDASTVVINRFITYINEQGLQALPDKPHAYTPGFQFDTESVLDVPPYDDTNRCYVLQEDSVLLYDHSTSDGRTRRCWRLQAKNVRDRNAKPINLFVLNAILPSNGTCPPCHGINYNLKHPLKICDKSQPACNQCRNSGNSAQCIAMRAIQDVGCNIIDEQFCPDRSKVIELGKVKVDVMNRMPEELDVEDWETPIVRTNANTRVSVSDLRSFIDVVSLFTWKSKHNPAVDLGGLWRSLGGHTISVWSKRGYVAPRAPLLAAKQVRFMPLPASWVPTKDSAKSKRPGKNFIQQVPVDISYEDDFNMDQIDNCLDLDGFALFKVPAPDIKTKKQKLAAEAARNIAFELIGHIGSPEAFRNVINQKREAFLASTVSKHYAETRGPYNGGPIWTRPIRSPSKIAVSISPGIEVIKNVTANVDIKAKHRVFNLDTVIDDRACLAFVMQQSLNALAEGNGLLKMLFAAYLAAQYLETGQLTRDDVLATHCVCADDETRAKTEHHCMSCFAIRPCIRMGRRLTESGVLFECQTCLALSSNLFTFKKRDVAYITKIGTHNMYKADAKSGKEPLWKIEDMHNFLVSTHVSPTDDDVWIDGYSKKQVSTHDTKYPSDMKLAVGNVRKHPYALSLEKPFPRWIDDNGNLSLHHLDNITLTKNCINLCKGNFPPSIISLLNFALSYKRLSMQDGIQLQQGIFWQRFDRATDNIRMINALSPYKTRDRVVKDVSDAQIRQVIEMGRSGIWDGKTLPQSIEHSSALFKTVGMTYRGRRALREKFPLWTNAQWRILLKNLEQMENDTRPGGFNPHGLRFLRLGKNKIPWFSRKDTCPVDADKIFIYFEYLSRLHTMTYYCNRAHKTVESPATLFLEHGAQWLETAGRCHFFGFVMTPFVGHPTNYSIGRGVVQKLSDGSERDIKPGEAMATGCIRLFPSDMFTEYDPTRRTVIFESWRANALRFDYPGGRRLLGILETAVLDLAQKTKWYGPLLQLDDYAEVEIPKTYKDRTRHSTDDTSDISDTNSSDDEFIDDEDEECMVLTARHEQIQAVQQCGDLEKLGQAPAEVQTSPKTYEDIERMHAEDTKYLSDLDLDPEAKKVLMEKMGRWMDHGKEWMRSTIDVKNISTALPEGSAETPHNSAHQLGILSGRYEVYADIYSTDPENVGGKAAFHLANMKEAVDMGETDTFAEEEEMFKKQLPDVFGQ